MTERFHKLSAELASRTDLGSTEKILLAIITNRIGKNGLCWPSVRTLARDAGIDKSTVLRAVATLQKTGDLIVDNHGQGRSQAYRLLSSTVREMRTVNATPTVRKARTGVRKTRTELSAKCVHIRTSKRTNKRTIEKKPITNDPVVLEFPTVDGTYWQLLESKLREYQQTFPDIDAAQECRKARQWCVDNPSRQKTARGILKFLSGWLNRAEPRAGREPEKHSEAWWALQEPRLEEEFDKPNKLGKYAEVPS